MTVPPKARRWGAWWGAVALAIAAGLEIGIWPTALALAVAEVLALAFGALGGGRRLTRALGATWPTAPAAVIAGALIGAAMAVSPAAHEIRSERMLRHRATLLDHAHLSFGSRTTLDVLLGGALVCALLALRTLRRPRPIGQPGSSLALARAREIVAEHGDDSLSPFILRPDKRFEFSAEGVIAYTIIGETAVVSGDPVGPGQAGAEALAQLQRRTRAAGLELVVYGASTRHLATYRSLGLRACCAGEEAVVDPADFTLQGRRVRKLRQSVHRLQRRGWRTELWEGRDIDVALEAEIDSLERSWRGAQGRVLGFAMSLGEFDIGVRPADVYLLGFAPDGSLRAVMRFLAHGDRLSLDTMRRIGETPNGLNEALVCRALEFARDRGVPAVSLNYAGLGHLFRPETPTGGRWTGLRRLALRPLRAHFQMDRLVQFNEKFTPRWHPRYLVYGSRAALPRSVVRVLQAEGYLPRPRASAPDAIRPPAHPVGPGARGRLG